MTALYSIPIHPGIMQIASRSMISFLDIFAILDVASSRKKGAAAHMKLKMGYVMKKKGKVIEIGWLPLNLRHTTHLLTRE